MTGITLVGLRCMQLRLTRSRLHENWEYRMDNRFIRDGIPLLFILIFVGSLLVLAITGH